MKQTSIRYQILRTIRSKDGDIHKLFDLILLCGYSTQFGDQGAISIDMNWWGEYIIR